jgi:hypothetical protein
MQKVGTEVNDHRSLLLVRTLYLLIILYVVEPKYVNKIRNRRAYVTYMCAQG